MPFVTGAASCCAGSEGEYRLEDTVLLGEESMSGRSAHSAKFGASQVEMCYKKQVLPNDALQQLDVHHFAEIQMRDRKR